MTGRNLKNETKVPPDGGYGWIVTFAYALNNVTILPLIISFGLVFQEAFEDTGVTATQGTLIISLNHGIGMLLSFAQGPILRRFGYRKVAVAGALFAAIGLMLTAAAPSVWMFLVSYSILNAIGIAALMASFSLAINSFFKEKRGRAVGVGMSITGLGAIYMPLVISFLINTYGWRYAVLILGALVLHSLIAACLLRPVKWYLKNPILSHEMEPLNKETEELVNDDARDNQENINESLRQEQIVTNGSISVKSLSMRTLPVETKLEIRNSASQPNMNKELSVEVTKKPVYKWWKSQEINLGSSVDIFYEGNSEINNDKKNTTLIIQEKSKTYFSRFVNYFDLTLLKDPVFINILLGISLASCAETNFSLLLPLILKDMFLFDTSDIAKLMAIIGFSDTLFRLISPFVGEWCNKTPRVMYMVSILLVMFTRFVMLFAETFTGMVLVSLALGMTKGARTVYINIIIPSYVPIERLPYATGIQYLFNGVVIITMATVIGRLREVTGSYNVPIIVINIVTLVTLIFWSAEFLYFRVRKQRKSQDTEGS